MIAISILPRSSRLETSAALQRHEVSPYTTLSRAFLARNGKGEG